MSRWWPAWSAIAILSTIGLTSLARAEPVEAPADAPEGEDVVYESDDSLGSGEVELGLGLEGSTARAPIHRRRVRFDEPDFSGTLREGEGDPLAGGEVKGGTARERFVAGKLSPRWARGLLLGTQGDPWQRRSFTLEGSHRGRAGEGVMVSQGESRGLDVVAGRFSHRDLLGTRVRAGPLGLSVVTGRRRELQSSLAWAREGGEMEAALDRGGAWRAEGLLERTVSGWTTTGGVRVGSPTFRSLAEPSRNGPARALTFTATGSTWAGETRGLASAWRFHAGHAGARIGIECRRWLADGSRLAYGFEEQRGARKETAKASDALRQGGWLEWSSPEQPLRLAVRHESWGARPILRDVVRSVTSARVDARAPLGLEVSLAHSVFRTRRGESLYLAEVESDRLVLRALSGEGQRSRLEIAAPAGRRGSVRASLLVQSRSSRPSPPQWTIEWIRRSRPERDASPASP